MLGYSSHHIFSHQIYTCINIRTIGNRKRIIPKGESYITQICYCIFTVFEHLHAQTNCGITMIVGANYVIVRAGNCHNSLPMNSLYLQV